jgi:hypothetical protein
MKKDIVFFIMAILLFLLSCKEENTLQFMVDIMENVWDIVREC